MQKSSQPWESKKLKTKPNERYPYSGRGGAIMARMTINGLTVSTVVGTMTTKIHDFVSLYV